MFYNMQIAYGQYILIAKGEVEKERKKQEKVVIKDVNACIFTYI